MIRSQKTCLQCGQKRVPPSIPTAKADGSKRSRQAPGPTKAGITPADKIPAHSSTSAWIRETEPLEPGTVVRRLIAAIPVALAGASEELRDAGTTSTITSAVRSAVLSEFRTRAQLTGRICEIDARLWAETGLSPTGRRTIDDHLLQLGLRRVTDPAEAPDLFVVTEGHGEVLELVRPAYRDEITGQTVLGGQLRRREAAASQHGGAHSEEAARNARGEAQ
ncbi:hypothetical protein [Kitasatospora purpeofusca]|uniref:hypothetical protein n=1 Tax=Kitasatospora purpeofusca TaxID=67352 RepID=UPI002A5ADF58|nr:hypothetical protein [Kitasatospora purpeofusca]MDY0812388.1 hypothetical protein [Kitasatospora purpeofusca]